MWMLLEIIMIMENTTMDMERTPDDIIIRLETYSDIVVSRGNNVTPNIREMNREMDIYEVKFCWEKFF